MANPYPLLTFQQLYKEITGEVSPLPDLQAMRLVNRAWKWINDYRMWSWQQVSNAQLTIPIVISAGSVTVTYQSTAVVADSGAAAAINAYITSGQQPPLYSPVLGVGMQIRLGSAQYEALASPIGPNYTIINWDAGTKTLTIDAPYGQSTAVGASYQILKAFYAAPFLPVTATTTDVQFSRFLSVTDYMDGYTIAGRQLYFSQEELNRIDPQRGGQGDAYVIAYLAHNSQGQPVYELYPNPVNPNTLVVNYVSKGPLLTMNTGLPNVSYALDDAVIFRAKALAGQWALANVGRYPKELGQVNWVAYIAAQKQEFKETFIQCIKEDDEIMPSPKPFVYNGGYSFPLGGEFLQSHDISSILPPV